MTRSSYGIGTLVAGVFAAVFYVGVLLGGSIQYSQDRPAQVDSAWFRSLTPSQQRDSIVAKEARRAGTPVALAIAVSHTENWTGDSAAVSSAGAIGIMQVMPLWQHSFEADCGCASLFNRRANACRGTRVLKLYLDSLPTVNLALRSYHGSNKPRLHLAGDGYVGTVLQRIVFPRDGTTVTP